MAKSFDQHFQENLAYPGLPALASHSAWTPNTDVYESEDSLYVKIEIAGIEKDDVEIALTDRLLLVRGYRKDPTDVPAEIRKKLKFHFVRTIGDALREAL